MSSFRKALFNGWSNPNWATFISLPLTLIYRLLSGLRGLAYHLSIAKSHRVAVPVIIVGNISVGGTGKTPLTLALIDLLIEQGYKPGVISRGYGGKAIEWPQVVKPDSNPHYMGDEAVLIAAKAKCPVVVGPERTKAAQRIISEFAVDIIVSDDGLQHKALDRDIEIAVIDMQRQHKNLFCLPAGPLREPVKRLQSVDMVLLHKSSADLNTDSNVELLRRLGLPSKSIANKQFTMQLKPQALQPVLSPELSSIKQDITVPNPPTCIHAVAGIGHPQRFFKLLVELGYDVIEHAFDDHHEFVVKDFQFNGSVICEEPIVMTEKDAVKCIAFAADNFFFLPVTADLNDAAKQHFLNLLNGIEKE